VLATNIPVGILVKLTTLPVIILSDIGEPLQHLCSLFIVANGLGNLNIVLGLSGDLIVQVQETIVNTELYRISAGICICRLDVSYQGVLLARNVRNVHVVSRWGKILQLLAGEDVFSNEMNLGVSMLSSLRGRHVDDLARTLLDENVSTLPQGRTLHGVGQGRTRIGRVDGVILL
jgi:hypothetical protein